MKLSRLSSIFDVHYGSNLELNSLSPDPKGINFVSRTAKNNGVSSKVRSISDLKPIEAGVITVAGGGSVLETFLQTEPFYSGRDLYYLTPLTKLSTTEKLFYCACIRANKYRYSYGRQANRTLKDLLIPSLDRIPSWVNETNLDFFEDASRPFSHSAIQPFSHSAIQPFSHSAIFISGLI